MRLSYLITGAAVLILLACGIEQVALIRMLWLLGVVTLIGGVMAIREASGNVAQIIAEVHERESGEDVIK